MESFACEAPALVIAICRTGAAKLQKLTLVDARLFGPAAQRFVDGNNSPWPYLRLFSDVVREHCPNLRSLVLERVFFVTTDKPMGHAGITLERREWKGRDGVLTGLTSLIASMTKLDPEQQEKWFANKIDTDGNEPVPETTEV